MLNEKLLVHMWPHFFTLAICHQWNLPLVESLDHLSGLGFDEDKQTNDKQKRCWGCLLDIIRPDFNPLMPRWSLPEGGGGGRPGLVSRSPQRGEGGLLPCKLCWSSGVKCPLCRALFFFSRVSFQTKKKKRKLLLFSSSVPFYFKIAWNWGLRP